MLPSLFNFANNFIDIPQASGHCDIPCKIYDPSTAIIGALSVVRLIDIMVENEPSKSDRLSLNQLNTLMRCIQRKEEEAERVKHEIRVIWGDFFKEPQLEAHPSAHELVHNIMMVASSCKQEVSRPKAEELLEHVNTFAEMFWESKGIETERKISPYPPSLSVTYPVL